MNAQDIRGKAFVLGKQIKELVQQFEDETDTTVTDIALARIDEFSLSPTRRRALGFVHVGVRVL